MALPRSNRDIDIKNFKVNAIGNQNAVCPAVFNNFFQPLGNDNIGHAQMIRFLDSFISPTAPVLKALYKI